jgi:hypothetical protein
MWRSLVAHLLWEQGVGGSNPLIPTIVISQEIGNGPNLHGSDRLGFLGP